MTQTEFDKLVKQLNNYAEEIRLAKRPEYTLENSDVLTNFHNTAERLGISELKCFGVFFDKQLQSIFSHINNANLKKSEPIHSRFADIINYCYLGYALFVERDGKKKNN
jgi:molecular chaperone GrpE (heat shock protein)